MADPDAQPWAILCVSAVIAALVTWFIARLLLHSATSRATGLPLAIVGGLRLWLLGTCVLAIVATKLLLGSEPFSMWGDDGQTRLLFKIRDLGLSVVGCGLLSIPLELVYVGVVRRRSGQRLGPASFLLVACFCALVAFMLTDIGLFVPMV